MEQQLLQLLIAGATITGVIGLWRLVHPQSFENKNARAKVKRMGAAIILAAAAAYIATPWTNWQAFIIRWFVCFSSSQAGHEIVNNLKKWLEEANELLENTDENLPL